MAFSFFDRVKAGLEKTKNNFVKKVETIVIGYAEIDDDFLDDLEATMLVGDLGPKTTAYLMKEIRRGVTEGIINNTGEVMPFMEERITEMLGAQEEVLELHKPEVILVVGVNGVGKTTTIAKLAHYYAEQGKKVIIAAGDTFRAAASEQLSIWADRVGVSIVKHKEGADPAAVVFDACASAVAKEADLVIVDTAGRLHTKVNLMEELKKIRDLIFDKFKKKINLKNIIILGPNPDAIKWVNMVYRYNLTIKVLEDYDVFRQFLTELIFNKKYSFNTEKNGKLILTID